MTGSTLRNRHSIRLKGFDYSLEGAYFVTILTYHRTSLFGNIAKGVMELNPSGRIAFDQWMQLEKRFLQSDFSFFVIMPNHVHGIIFISNGEDKESKIIHAQTHSLNTSVNPNIESGTLGSIVRAYKASVAFRINALRGFKYPAIWQRNYFERVIRNEKEYENIRKYIEINPDRWDEDEYYSSSKDVYD